MASILFKGNPASTIGDLPARGTKAPNFKLTRIDLTDVYLEDYKGKKKVLNIFPSIDTPVCATSVRKFNEAAAGLNGVVVLNVSCDLPFAHKRFCGAEGIDKVESLSTFRSTFSTDYQVEMMDTPLQGLCSRAIVVLNESDEVIHSEQVSDIAKEPDYDAALASLK